MYWLADLPPCRRQAPTRGLDAVNAHHRPIRDVTKHPCPLLVGHGCVNPGPKALAPALPALPGLAGERAEFGTVRFVHAPYNAFHARVLLVLWLLVRRNP